MFGIGRLEILIIVVAVFLLSRPEDLPRVARSIARTMGRIRRMMASVDSEIRTFTRDLEGLDEEKNDNTTREEEDDRLN